MATFLCDACRIRPGQIDNIGRRLCNDPGCCVDDKTCPVLSAPCPWPWDCDGCQMEETP